MTDLPRPLRGIVPPLLTPLADRDTLDAAGLERLVEHVLAGGVAGLFVLGTTGEGPSLSYKLRCEVAERVCQQVAGRVPVLVGASDASLTESVNLAEVAADAGAAAVVLAAPFYFPVGQEELARHFERAAAESPLPVVLYNMPSHTKLGLEPATVARLLEQPAIAGLKDSSGDMRYFQEVRRLAAARPDWPVLMGPEELLAAAVLLGGHGGVCGGANLCPRLYVDLYEAAARGDVDRASDLQERVLQVSRGLYTVASGGGGVIKGLKAALACLGVCNDTVAEPLAPMTEAQRAVVRQRVEGLGVEEYLEPRPLPEDRVVRHTQGTG